MTWNSDPMVRDLADYCNKHSFPIGIFWGVTKDGEHCQFVTFGKSKKLCEYAKKIGVDVQQNIFEQKGDYGNRK